MSFNAILHSGSSSFPTFVFWALTGANQLQPARQRYIAGERAAAIASPDKESSPHAARRRSHFCPGSYFDIKPGPP